MQGYRTKVSRLPVDANSACPYSVAVADMRSETTTTLQTFGHEREVMAKALQSWLAASRTSRTSEVISIRNDAADASFELRRDHEHMRQSLRRKLIQHKMSVSSAVAELFKEHSKARTAYSKAYRQMGKTQCRELSRGRRLRSRVVADLLRSFKKAHHHMAKVQHMNLALARKERSRAVAELLNGFHLTRQAMADDLERDLAMSVQETRAHVSDLRRSVTEMLTNSLPTNSSLRTGSLHVNSGLQVEHAAVPFVWPTIGQKHKLQTALPAKSGTRSLISDADKYLGAKVSKKK